EEITASDRRGEPDITHPRPCRTKRCRLLPEQHAQCPYVVVATGTPQGHILWGSENLFHRLLKLNLTSGERFGLAEGDSLIVIFVLVRRQARLSSPGPACRPSRDRIGPQYRH